MSLTLDRIFGDPDLNGPTPLQLKWSPDGQNVSYLKASYENFERLDLWRYDVSTQTHSLLVDASMFSSNRVLSDAEKARRERLRISHQGIVEYYWSPNADALLFPIEGNLYLYRLDDAAEPIKQLTDQTTFETDIKFSPDGEQIAFVRDQNVYSLNLMNNDLTQLTTDGGGLISCGLAEFIAQEEMHRFDGYWWSPDSTQIAFMRVDESPVEVSQRYEIDADNFGVFDQRYPFAGETNAGVRLGVVELTTKAITWIDLEQTIERYLPRVNWFRDSQHLAIQSQSRNQQTLDLVKYRVKHDVKNEQQQHLLTETSASWININDNFVPLEDNHFIWGSQRTGYNHLYRFDSEGQLVAQLTSGNWVVTDVKAVADAFVYFEGFKDTPLEKHLYRVSTSGGDIERITSIGFTHQTTPNKQASLIIDRKQSALRPLRVELIETNGSVVECLEANNLENDHPFAPFIKIRGAHEFAEIEAEDGQALHYRVIKPSSNRLEREGQYPLLLTVYGGPGVQRVSNEWIPPWHHYMASRGYGLLQLDNRGTANRGRDFESPIFGKLGDVEVRDQTIGIEQTLADYPIDADRMAVFGHSYGGYMTLMLMMKTQLFKAGVSVAPVTDWALYDTHYTERYLGMPSENSSGYADSAVFPYVKDLTGKLLIIHGMADDNVLFSNSTKLYKALQDENIDFEIMNYPGAKHGLTGRSVNLHRYSLMDRFLNQHLNGDNA